jgi:hypothetical protein
MNKRRVILVVSVLLWIFVLLLAVLDTYGLDKTSGCKVVSWTWDAEFLLFEDYSSTMNVEVDVIMADKSVVHGEVYWNGLYETWMSRPTEYNGSVPCNHEASRVIQSVENVLNGKPGLVGLGGPMAPWLNGLRRFQSSREGV